MNSVKNLAGRILAVAVIAIAALAAPGTDAAAVQDKADLSRLVVVGDSISAGHQNSSLLAPQQVNSYASVLARQAGVELPLPLISYPGFPNVLEVKSFDPLVIGPVEGTPGMRIDPQVVPHNLSVPGSRVIDALVRNPTSPFHGPYPFPELSALVLGTELNGQGQLKSQVDWALELQPTTILLWLGSNDVLWAAIFADSRFITDVDAFRAAYHEVIGTLAATGATMVVGNVPDIASIPFLTSAEEASARTGVPMSLMGLEPGDYVTPTAFTVLQMGMLPLPDNLDVFGIDVVVRAGEIQAMQAATAAFNAIIAEEAAAHGAPIVDFHAVLNMVDAYGLVVGGQRLTTDFLGGVFTLDGIHPTNTAHAVIANEFIRVLNTRFAAGIPPVSVQQVYENDPLVLPQVGRPASALRALHGRAMDSIAGADGF